MSAPGAAMNVESSPGPLVDQGGRPLGPRARQTRRRILDATVELLGEKPLRDLKVIEIARRIGTSPATFYQYFKDIEDVALELSIEVSEKTPELVDLILGDWDGPAGFARGRELVRLSLAHWERYAPVLRVRNYAADDGDERFHKVRRDALLPIVRAYEEVIRRSQAKGAERDRAPTGEGGWQGGPIDPAAGAVACASVVDRMVMHCADIQSTVGTDREKIIDSAATLLQFMLTSRR